MLDGPQTLRTGGERNGNAVEHAGQLEVEDHNNVSSLLESTFHHGPLRQHVTGPTTTHPPPRLHRRDMGVGGAALRFRPVPPAHQPSMPERVEAAATIPVIRNIDPPPHHPPSPEAYDWIDIAAAPLPTDEAGGNDLAGAAHRASQSKAVRSIRRVGHHHHADAGILDHARRFEQRGDGISGYFRDPRVEASFVTFSNEHRVEVVAYSAVNFVCVLLMAILNTVLDRYSISEAPTKFVFLLLQYASALVLLVTTGLLLILQRNMLVMLNSERRQLRSELQRVRSDLRMLQSSRTAVEPDEAPQEVDEDRRHAVTTSDDDQPHAVKNTELWLPVLAVSVTRHQIRLNARNCEWLGILVVVGQVLICIGLWENRDIDCFRSWATTAEEASAGNSPGFSLLPPLSNAAPGSYTSYCSNSIQREAATFVFISCNIVMLHVRLPHFALSALTLCVATWMPFFVAPGSHSATVTLKVALALLLGMCWLCGCASVWLRERQRRQEFVAYVETHESAAAIVSARLNVEVAVASLLPLRAVQDGALRHALGLWGSMNAAPVCAVRVGGFASWVTWRCPNDAAFLWQLIVDTISENSSRFLTTGSGLAVSPLSRVAQLHQFAGLGDEMVLLLHPSEAGNRNTNGATTPSEVGGWLAEATMELTKLAIVIAAEVDNALSFWDSETAWSSSLKCTPSAVVECHNRTKPPVLRCVAVVDVGPCGVQVLPSCKHQFPVGSAVESVCQAAQRHLLAAQQTTTGGAANVAASYSSTDIESTSRPSPLVVLTETVADALGWTEADRRPFRNPQGVDSIVYVGEKVTPNSSSGDGAKSLSAPPRDRSGNSAATPPSSTEGRQEVREKLVTLRIDPICSLRSEPSPDTRANSLPYSDEPPWTSAHFEARVVGKLSPTQGTVLTSQRGRESPSNNVATNPLEVLPSHHRVNAPGMAIDKPSLCPTDGANSCEKPKQTSLDTLVRDATAMQWKMPWGFVFVDETLESKYRGRIRDPLRHGERVLMNLRLLVFATGVILVVAGISGNWVTDQGRPFGIVLLAFMLCLASLFIFRALHRFKWHWSLYFVECMNWCTVALILLASLVTNETNVLGQGRLVWIFITYQLSSERPLWLPPTLMWSLNASAAILWATQAAVRASTQFATATGLWTFLLPVIAFFGYTLLFWHVRDFALRTGFGHLSTREALNVALEADRTELRDMLEVMAPVGLVKDLLLKDLSPYFTGGLDEDDVDDKAEHPGHRHHRRHRQGEVNVLASHKKRRRIGAELRALRFMTNVTEVPLAVVQFRPSHVLHPLSHHEMAQESRSSETITFWRDRHDAAESLVVDAPLADDREPSTGISKFAAARRDMTLRLTPPSSPAGLSTMECIRAGHDVVMVANGQAASSSSSHRMEKWDAAESVAAAVIAAGVHGDVNTRAVLVCGSIRGVFNGATFVVHGGVVGHALTLLEEVPWGSVVSTCRFARTVALCGGREGVAACDDGLEFSRTSATFGIPLHWTVRGLGKTVIRFVHPVKGE